MLLIWSPSHNTNCQLLQLLGQNMRMNVLKQHDRGKKRALSSGKISAPSSNDPLVFCAIGKSLPLDIPEFAEQPALHAVLRRGAVTPCVECLHPAPMTHFVCLFLNFVCFIGLLPPLHGGGGIPLCHAHENKAGGRIGAPGKKEGWVGTPLSLWFFYHKKK